MEDDPDAPRERPEIVYPCTWTWVLVGEGESILLGHVEVVLAGVAHEKSVKRQSAQGRYTSIEVTLVVQDEEHRYALGRRFLDHPAVRIVL
jgi:putative lipoic acid-binding regulatory protein